MRSVALGPTFKVNLPSKSVMAPLEVPFSIILTPTIGSWSTSVTTPVTVWVWADIPILTKSIVKIKITFFIPLVSIKFN